MVDGKDNYTKTGGLEGYEVLIVGHVLVIDSNVILKCNDTELNTFSAFDYFKHFNIKFFNH